MKSRQEIKARAREALREQRATAIIMNVIYFVPMILLVALVTPAIGRTIHFGVELLADYIIMFFMMVVLVGCCFVYMKIYKNEQAEIGEMFNGFGQFGRNFLTGVLLMVHVFLWMLLLIVPGIIKSLSYSWTFFILAQSKGPGIRKSIQTSMKITQGHKADIFIFHLSFIGWYLLGALTAGILLVVFVIPYHYISLAGYYMEMRDEAIAAGRITAEDLE